METIKIKSDDLSLAKQMIKEGKVLAFPTDTVFGLGVHYNDLDALNRLKASKKRDANKPIPMMVKNYEQLTTVCKVNKRISKIAEKLMPGALTIIVERKESVASFNSDGKSTIAIRMPDSKLVQELLEEPMLVTSANISGEPSLKNSDDVLKSLDGRIDGIILGEANSEIASTIVDLTGDEIKILREGKIKETEILACLEEE